MAHDTKRTKFEPPKAETAGDAMGFASIVAYVEPLPPPTFEEREAELNVMISGVQDEREQLEADRAAHLADVAAFELAIKQHQKLPSTITLEQDFGFSVNGVLRLWPAGRAITSAEDIALLFAKKAHIEGYLL